MSALIPKRPLYAYTHTYIHGTATWTYTNKTDVHTDARRMWMLYYAGPKCNACMHDICKREVTSCFQWRGHRVSLDVQVQPGRTCSPWRVSVRIYLVDWFHLSCRLISIEVGGRKLSESEYTYKDHLLTIPQSSLPQLKAMRPFEVTICNKNFPTKNTELAG